MISKFWNKPPHGLEGRFLKTKRNAKGIQLRNVRLPLAAAGPVGANGPGHRVALLPEPRDADGAGHGVDADPDPAVRHVRVHAHEGRLPHLGPPVGPVDRQAALPHRLAHQVLSCGVDKQRQRQEPHSAQILQAPPVALDDALAPVRGKQILHGPLASGVVRAHDVIGLAVDCLLDKLVGDGSLGFHGYGYKSPLSPGAGLPLCLWRLTSS